MLIRQNYASVSDLNQFLCQAPLFPWLVAFDND
jgi:hypothetical protein